MKIEQENKMLKKLVEPMVTIPENSELFIQRKEQPCMVKQSSGLFTPTVFFPEDLQKLNCAFPQIVYYPPMEMLPSSCVYCHHLNQFCQTMPHIQHVNFRAVLSTDKYCADLPFSDMQTFQYFYNLGIEYCQGFYANAASYTGNNNRRNDNWEIRRTI